MKNKGYVQENIYIYIYIIYLFIILYLHVNGFSHMNNSFFKIKT